MIAVLKALLTVKLRFAVKLGAMLVARPGNGTATIERIESPRTSLCIMWHLPPPLSFTPV